MKKIIKMGKNEEGKREGKWERVLLYCFVSFKSLFQSIFG